MHIKGNVSLREDEAPKLLLSFAEPLAENGTAKAEKTQATVYVRVGEMNDSVCRAVLELATTNKGESELVFFSLKEKKYYNAKGYKISLDEETKRALHSIAGEKNVAVRE